VAEEEVEEGLLLRTRAKANIPITWATMAGAGGGSARKGGNRSRAYESACE
jgi:hypothetical protein